MLAVVAPTDLEGKSGRMVKQILSDQLGISRFRQRLFCEGGFLEIPDAMIFEAVPLKVELVVLNFCPPEPRDTQRIIAASRANASASLEKLLQRPMDPNLVDQHGLPFFLGQESIRCTGTTKMENIHGEKVCSNSVLSFLAKLQARNLFWSVHDFEKETHI